MRDDEKELLDWLAIGYLWGRLDGEKQPFEFSDKWVEFVRAQDYKRLGEAARHIKDAYEEWRNETHT